MGQNNILAPTLTALVFCQCLLWQKIAALNQVIYWRKKEISLYLTQGTTDLVKKSGSADIPKPSKQLVDGIGGAFAVGGLIVPILFIPGVVFMQMGDKIAQDHKTITDNLTRKSFSDCTIFPNESHSGFIYFPVKSNEIGQNDMVINVKAINMTNNNTMPFIFEVKNNGNDKRLR